ncbi:MAG TPA: hypothetical protein VIU40_04710 [Geobacteraceae bacterium]
MQTKLSITAIVTLSFFLLFIGMRSTDTVKKHRLKPQPRAVAEYEQKSAKELSDPSPCAAEPVERISIPLPAPLLFSPSLALSPSSVCTTPFIASRASPLPTVRAA